MFSLVITTFNEPKTLERLLLSIKKAKFKEEYKVFVVAPDENSKKVVAKFPEVRFLRDKGKGKPSALNFALKYLKGDIAVFTDGDIYFKGGSVEKLILHLRKNPELGAVSGRPVPINKRDNFFGFLAHFLTFSAHQWRKKASALGEYFDCSGYLFACYKDIIPFLPEDCLAEDSYISSWIFKKGYKIGYVEQGVVFVKFPTNLSDWLCQKTRTITGQRQIRRVKEFKDLKTRSLFEEIKQGVWLLFIFPRNIKEFFWLILLCFLRLYVWIKSFFVLKFRKEKDIWKRVETTKNNL